MDDNAHVNAPSTKPGTNYTSFLRGVGFWKKDWFREDGGKEMIMLIMAHGTDENRVNEDGWKKTLLEPALLGQGRHPGSPDGYNY